MTEFRQQPSVVCSVNQKILIQLKDRDLLGSLLEGYPMLSQWVFGCLFYSLQTFTTTGRIGGLHDQGTDVHIIFDPLA